MPYVTSHECEMQREKDAGNKMGEEMPGLLGK